MGPRRRFVYMWVWYVMPLMALHRITSFRHGPAVHILIHVCCIKHGHNVNNTNKRARSNNNNTNSISASRSIQIDSFMCVHTVLTVRSRRMQFAANWMNMFAVHSRASAHRAAGHKIRGDDDCPRSIHTPIPPCHCRCSSRWLAVHWRAHRSAH